ncbi:ribosomal protein L30E [Paenibacillus sp. V4I3]|nr:ribosomal protein L30E [Paenibacillus sp. V4I3]MDQ0890228.1 ribosomal protein L30E [Paenibacillus sp. V4I9]
MTEMSAKDFRQVIDVDLNAPFIVANAFKQSMIKKGGGKIISICSRLSELGRETVSAYAAAAPLQPVYHQQDARGPLGHAGRFARSSRVSGLARIRFC